MDGKVRVLLVSAGAAPDALVTELERLGVEITSCSFADAEEYLETNPPDLVALAGALGAVELANMIDDLDEGPRMVIVAERRELAKLRGLNREVVVSLFAMETTEKVVGQRIESLARRAARRREHKAGPDTKPLKKTALGLPSAAQVAKVDLKKMEAPPSVRQKPVVADDAAPPSSGTHPGAEPPADTLPTEQPSPSDDPPGAASPPTPAKPDAGEATGGSAETKKKSALDEDPWLRKEPPPPIEKKLQAPEHKKPAVVENTATPKANKRPPPVRKKPAPLARPKPDLPRPPSPARSAQEEAEQSIMVIDADLLESILPDAPEGEIPEISVIPMMSAAPDPDEAPVSHPPTLPPAAKVQGARVPELELKAAPEDLDISQAESALENLDSAKLEITPDLVEQAQKEMRSQDRDLYDEDTVVGRVPGGGMDSPDESRRETETPSPGAPVVSELSLDKTLALQAVPTDATGTRDTKNGAEGDASDLDASSSPDVDRPVESGGPGVAERRIEASGTTSTSTGGEGIAPSAPVSTRLSGVAAKQKSSGVKAWGLIAVAALALGGVYALQSGSAEKGDEGANAQVLGPTQERPRDSVSPATPLDGDHPAGNDEGEAHATDDAPIAADQPDEAEPGSGNAEERQPEDSSASGTPLENPFKRPATPAPTCETMVASAPPEKGDDPIHLASEAWDQARAAIVGGKLEEAHKYMCQAVALNPQSAAIEGLAGHYLALGDFRQALEWAEKADALRPGQMDVGNLKGDVYGMMGDVDRAREIWLDMLNIGPDEQSRLVPISKDYSVEAGRHLRRGDLVRAELFFRRAVILDAENLNGIIGLAKVYHRLEMPQYARAFCEMSLKVSDVIPEVHVLLGELALADGKQDEARARFERALAVRPGFFPAKRGLSQVK